VRRFLKGDVGVVGEMVQRIMGSPDLYLAAGRKPAASVNFITCQMASPLRLFHTEKHNLDGENNDGANDNYSWNCGVEARRRQRLMPSGCAAKRHCFLCQ
jgi:glycogen operon protein